ncbi:hypothetical protein KUL72_07840 [Bradyrhizobium arachidis]|uniref:hypothetical protein n=1 Tax=Bradyrhizobium arachidis TaxID=858423 RepID=UPI002163A30F|nr:hypothetical protein [Bradyrhizobium arachidis]UVO38265.1 hypothetical protein KUL72_07840 [Bradyrhizobium arachidis]
MTFTNTQEGASGQRRMKSIAREAKAEIDQLAAHLLEALGRPPEAIDRIWAAATAATHIRAARLRALGRSDHEAMSLLVQLLARDTRPIEIVGEVDRNVTVLPRPATA